jgi:hypothetical protein
MGIDRTKLSQKSLVALFQAASCGFANQEWSATSKDYTSDFEKQIFHLNATASGISDGSQPH